MIIQKAILHILDLTSNICVISQEELDYSKEDVREFIEKHINKVFADPNKREGMFKQGSKYLEHLNDYRGGKESFYEFSYFIVERIHQKISNAENLESMDLLLVEFNENDVNYLVMFLWNNKMAYTHQVSTVQNQTKNEIIRHYAILPNTSQKIDSYAFLNLSNFALEFVDKKRVIAGEETLLLPDRVLECNYNISSRETVKSVSEIAKTVAEEHGADPVKAVSRTKKFIAENGETSERLSPRELCDEVFAEDEILARAFTEKAKEANLPENVKVEQKYAVKSGSTHKIKTDTGIEIIFPSAFCDNTEYLRFINNENGTISIEIVNVGEISNSK